MHRDVVEAFLLQKADALVREDVAFFERVLHPDFVYVNTRGKLLDRAGYIARFASGSDVKFASQQVSDLTITSIGEVVIVHMALLDAFVRGAERRSFAYRSLCVFRVEGASCQWVAGQTMLPEPITS